MASALRAVSGCLKVAAPMARETARACLSLGRRGLKHIGDGAELILRDLGDIHAVERITSIARSVANLVRGVEGFLEERLAAFQRELAHLLVDHEEIVNLGRDAAEFIARNKEMLFFVTSVIALEVIQRKVIAPEYAASCSSEQGVLSTAFLKSTRENLDRYLPICRSEARSWNPVNSAFIKEICCYIHNKLQVSIT